MTTPYGEVPKDVDAETHRRIARSFYVVRMVRLSVLLGFAIVFLAVTVVTDEPVWASVLFGVLALAVVSLLRRTRQRWRSASASWQ